MDLRSSVLDADNQAIDFDDLWRNYTPLNKPLVLMYAAAQNSLAIVAALLRDKDIDVNAVYNYFIEKKTPDFTLLSRVSDPVVITLLLQAKADVTPAGCATVLQGACEKLQIDAVKLLLAAGADVNTLGDGHSAMYHAVHASYDTHDFVAVINYLFDMGASACNGKDGKSVLHFDPFCDTKELPVLRLLLAREPALVRCRDDDGATALMRVVEHYRYRAGLHIIKTLLDAGSDAKARDKHGATVLFYLLIPHTHGYDDTYIRSVLHLLLASGADPIACGYGGDTVLMQVMSQAPPSEENEFRFYNSDAAAVSLLHMVIGAVLTRPAVAAEEPKKKAQRREQGHGQEQRAEEMREGEKSPAGTPRARKRVKR
jgi:ankyrin repeat protein